MLFSLVDGHARTSTELAMVADVSPSTASVHLNRLKAEHLVKVHVQGKHRYYSLEGPNVASALEGLSVLAGGSRDKFVPNTPSRLLAARTCYDHLAGKLGVSLHDRFKALRWMSTDSTGDAYDLTPTGTQAFETLGIDLRARHMDQGSGYPIEKHPVSIERPVHFAVAANVESGCSNRRDKPEDGNNLARRDRSGQHGTCVHDGGDVGPDRVNDRRVRRRRYRHGDDHGVG
jgi:DNA-binding transcriptional ArsR family regulator